MMDGLASMYSEELIEQLWDGPIYIDGFGFVELL